jgi:hypothetical protein
MTPQLLAAQLFVTEPDACVNAVIDLVEKYLPDLTGEAKGEAVFDAGMIIGCGKDQQQQLRSSQR